jgi:hypothetical protein
MSNADALRPLRYLHTIHAAPECHRLRNIYTQDSRIRPAEDQTR